jgi:hypothetical protein
LVSCERDRPTELADAWQAGGGAVRNNVQPVTTSPNHRDRAYEYAREKRRRAQALRTCRCLWCGRVFSSPHDTARWCSHRCRTAAHRGPRHWALIVWPDWSGQNNASWSYHPTRAAAIAAAPLDVPASIVDVTTRPDPRITFPSSYEMK